MLPRLVAVALLTAGLPPVAPRRVPPFAAVPTITSLTPASAVAGGPGLTLTVTGTGFANNSKVRWQGSDRTTTHVSSTELRASITAADLATLGTPQVTVFNQGGNGGTSNAVAFTVGNPVPAIASLSPATVNVTAPAFTLAVNGSNFVSGSTVEWNGVARSTFFESPTRVTVGVLAADLAAPASVQVRVRNPGPGGGGSASVAFAIVLPTPSISSTAPSDLAIELHSSRVLQVMGSNFIPGSVIQWNGVDRITTFVGPTEIRTGLSPSDYAVPGPGQVRVRNAAGGQSVFSGSVTVPLAYVDPAFLQVLRTPSVVRQFDSFWNLRLIGYGFTSVATYTINDVPFTPNPRDYTNAHVTIRDVPYRGDVRFRVTNPAPGGGSGDTILTVLSPIPRLDSIGPNWTPQRTSAVTFRLRGDRFIPESVVFVGGAPRPTVYISRTELVATLPGSDLVRPGVLLVSVRNPDPGASASAVAQFIVR